MTFDKKTLEKLAELGRVEINPNKEEKLLSDLKAIFEHFEELKKVDTEGIEPLTGGTSGANVFRDDEIFKDESASENSVAAFPEKQNGYLKTPAVFE